MVTLTIKTWQQAIYSTSALEWDMVICHLDEQYTKVTTKEDAIAKSRVPIFQVASSVCIRVHGDKVKWPNVKASR
jgi:hypothetical protein